MYYYVLVLLLLLFMYYYVLLLCIYVLCIMYVSMYLYTHVGHFSGVLVHIMVVRPNEDTSVLDFAYGSYICKI